MIDKNKKNDSIVLQFHDFTLIREKMTFPNIYVALDSNDLTVWFKIFLLDKQEREGLNLANVKYYLSQVVDIDEWEIERDILFRGTEVYGIKRISKIKNIGEFRTSSVVT